MQADTARITIRRMLGSREFWRPRPLHPIARLLLLVVVGVLLCVSLGFIIATGRFTHRDFLAVMFYLALAAFAIRPTTAAFTVIAICGVGAVFTGSGGDLLELALALGLVAATCAPWTIAIHALVLSVLTANMAVNGSSLTDGGLFGIAGIAVIAFLAGIAFRLVTAREDLLISERARVVKDLEALARHEQERIADELHDGIAHDLTLVLFHARALPRQPDDAARQVSLTTIEDSAEKALESIQSLLALMHDTRSDRAGTAPSRYNGNAVEAVASLGALLNDAGITTTISTPREPLGVSEASERILAEIALEAVTNILKHAPNSQSATVGICRDTKTVELIVKNVAPPLSAGKGARTGGRGLYRARQRLAQCAGTLEAISNLDGWMVRATVPASSASQ